MRLILMVFALIFTFVAIRIYVNNNTNTIKPFVSDGCSVFPDGTYEEKDLWLTCCVDHDYAYWQGGTRTERLTADKQLKQCVEQIGNPNIASIMFAGVRVGGSPMLPTSYRWGYGWPYPRWYQDLSDIEKEQVNNSKNSSKY